MSPVGPRFTQGGYQMPRTNAASLKREKPIASVGPVGPWEATVELVPLVGSNRERVMWDLYVSWFYSNENGVRSSGGASCFLHVDVETAQANFAELAQALEDGYLPPR